MNKAHKEWYVTTDTFPAPASMKLLKRHCNLHDTQPATDILLANDAVIADTLLANDTATDDTLLANDAVTDDTLLATDTVTADTLLATDTVDTLLAADTIITVTSLTLATHTFAIDSLLAQTLMPLTPY